MTAQNIVDINRVRRSHITIALLTKVILTCLNTEKSVGLQRYPAEQFIRKTTVYRAPKVQRRMDIIGKTALYTTNLHRTAWNRWPGQTPKRIMLANPSEVIDKNLFNYITYHAHGAQLSPPEDRHSFREQVGQTPPQYWNWRIVHWPYRKGL